MENSKNQISHLIRLLDDRDDFVRTRVREKLIDIGQDALPFLEIAANRENPVIRGLAREIISAIFPRQLGDQFRKLVSRGNGENLDLESGVLLLMKFGYPDADETKVRNQLDQLAEELSLRLHPNEPPERVVEILTRFLFREKGFSGNQSDYLDPDNSYFNQVLERRTGIPITLSALTMFIANRLKLPIVGVGLPGHYIVQYSIPGSTVYFDPFFGGKRLTRQDCIRRVDSFGYNFEEVHLSQSTNRETLVRMINNLVAIYSQNQETTKVKQLREYVNILLGNSRRTSNQST